MRHLFIYMLVLKVKVKIRKISSIQIINSTLISKYITFVKDTKLQIFYQNEEVILQSGNWLFSVRIKISLYAIILKESIAPTNTNVIIRYLLFLAVSSIYL